jgi:hypothetical protein
MNDNAIIVTYRTDFHAGSQAAFVPNAWIAA